MTFMGDAGNASARLSDRVGKIKRRSRDAKPWGLDAEMTFDQLIEHLIVLTPADAMYEHIGNEEPENRGDGQRAWRQADVILFKPTLQVMGDGPAICISTKSEAIAVF